MSSDKERTQKADYGASPLEPRSAKTVPLSLHSFFRESKQLQLLRARLKESRAHLSVTRRDLAKVFAFVIRTPFQQNVLLSTPAARGGYAAGDVKLNFTQLLLQTIILRGKPRADLFSVYVHSFSFKKE